MANNSSDAVVTSVTSGDFALFEWIFIATALVGVVVNVSVVVALTGWRLLSSQTANILLIHQCVADGLSSFFAIIVWLSTTGYTVPGSFLGDIICFLWCYQFVFWAVVQVSINNLIVFTCERYLSVLHPIKHRRLTKKHLVVCLSLSWLLAVLITLGIPFTCTREGDTCAYVVADAGASILFLVVNIFFFFVFPVVVLVVLNARMITFLRRPASHLTTGHQARGHDAVSKELTITVAIAGAGFLLLAAPDTIITLLIGLNLYSIPAESFWYYFPTYLMTFTFILNPLVYVIRMPAFQRRVRLCCPRREHSEPSAATASSDIRGS